jgi:chemotaxis protein histidine kinase CheA
MSKAVMIDPRNAGLRGLELGKPVFSDDAVERADNALKEMADSFVEWLDADIARLQDARMRAEQCGWADAALTGVMAVAHDLKGMGGTYGYPLVTDLAASLCRLIETDAGKAAARAQASLVIAHIDALRAVVRDRIQTRGHPVGGAIVKALDAQVAALGVAPR